MGAGKNKVHRKKRISKHVLESQSRREKQRAELDSEEAPKIDQLGNSVNNDGSSAATAASKKKTKKEKVKNPQEAHSYLSGWKYRNSGDSAWKFNKNCQSWLIRHMYDTEKVPKATFALMADYLVEIKGAIRKRVQDDATRRALRYKSWENHEKNSGEISNDKNREDHNEKKSDFENGKNKNESKLSDESEIVDDESRWNSLDENTKRKEYKRSRKVLDSLKQQ